MLEFVFNAIFVLFIGIWLFFEFSLFWYNGFGGLGGGSFYIDELLLLKLLYLVVLILIEEGLGCTFKRFSLIYFYLSNVPLFLESLSGFKLFLSNWNIF